MNLLATNRLLSQTASSWYINIAMWYINIAMRMLCWHMAGERDGLNHSSIDVRDCVTETEMVRVLLVLKLKEMSDVICIFWRSWC